MSISAENINDEFTVNWFLHSYNTHSSYLDFEAVNLVSNQAPVLQFMYCPFDYKWLRLMLLCNLAVHSMLISGWAYQGEPQHLKTNKLTCAPSEHSDQTGHPPSLIRVFPVDFMGSWGPNHSSGGQQRVWSDWADAQADLSLHWALMSLGWFCHAVAQSDFSSTCIVYI